MLADVYTGSCLDLEIGSKFRIGRCKGCGEVGYKVNDIAIDDNLNNWMIEMTMTILDSAPSLRLVVARAVEGWHTRTMTLTITLIIW